MSVYPLHIITPQLMAEKQQVTREKEQLQQELQTANTRAGEWIQQLQQQVSDITIHRINIR